MIKNPKTVWQTITRVPKSKSKAITASLDKSNNFFSDIAENLTGKRPEYAQKTKLPVPIDNICQLSFIMTCETQLKKIRNDCSTDFDVVSVGLIKPVPNSSTLTHIVNNCIR